MNPHQADWREKAERLIAEVSYQAFVAANADKNGRMRRKHRPYRLPQWADQLVAALGRNDAATANAIMLEHPQELLAAGIHSNPRYPRGAIFRVIDSEGHWVVVGAANRREAAG